MAAPQEPLFSVRRSETVLIQPSQPTPTHLLSLSTLDNYSNLEFIARTIHVYSGDNDTNNHRYSKRDPASVIREALSKALDYYYPLAGKLKRHADGKLRVNCTGEGAPFMVATANCTLASLGYLDGMPLDITKCLVFESETNGCYHPLMIQVTLFACGGFTIGMGLSHSVCDGLGFAQFFQAMTELAGGKSEPSVKPVWERERLCVKENQNQELPVSSIFPVIDSATSPYLPTSDLLHESFNVGSESLRKLKMGNCETFTTLEALGAYLWRAKMRALEMNSDGETMLTIAVGIRKAIKPPLPEGYYGNANTESHAVLSVKELCEGPLSRVMKLIKESKRNAIASERVWQRLGALERMSEVNGKRVASGAALHMTDWRHLGDFEVDFGWKGQVNMIPVLWNLFGCLDLCILLPSFCLNPSMCGGVRVLVTFPRDAMAKFKEEMDRLNSEEPLV